MSEDFKRCGIADWCCANDAGVEATALANNLAMLSVEPSCPNSVAAGVCFPAKELVTLGACCSVLGNGEVPRGVASESSHSAPNMVVLSMMQLLSLVPVGGVWVAVISGSEVSRGASVTNRREQNLAFAHCNIYRLSVCLFIYYGSWYYPTEMMGNFRKVKNAVKPASE